MAIDMVRVSPVDVDYMMKSPAVIQSGKARKEVVEETLDVMLGHASRVPMAIIRMLTLKKPGVDPLCLCPFMNVVQKISVDMNVEGSNFEDSGMGGVCVLGQKYKPTICMLYPLGRFTSVKLDEHEVVDTMYVRLDCEGTKTAKKMKVRDWVGDYDEKDQINKRYIETMTTLVHRMNEEVNEPEFRDFIMQKMGGLFYYEEGDTNTKLDTIENTMDELIQVGKQTVKASKQKSNEEAKA
jgi:hypothetical protein